MASWTQEKKGFTLLEVLIALAILSFSLMSIYRSQSITINVTDYIRKLNMASNLARLKMSQVIHEMKQDGLSDFDEKNEGDFELQDITGYSWEVEMLKIELPIPTDLDSGALQEKNPTLAALAPFIKPQLENIKKNMEENVRQIKLTVYWDNKGKWLTLYDHHVTDKLLTAPAKKKAAPKKKAAGAKPSGPPKR